MTGQYDAAVLMLPSRKSINYTELSKIINALLVLMISFLCYEEHGLLANMLQTAAYSFYDIPISFHTLSPSTQNPLHKLIWGSALIKYQSSAPHNIIAVLLAVLDYLDALAEAATSELEVQGD